MTVTVVSCLYGNNGYDRFLDRWWASVQALDPAPDQVIVATDQPCSLAGAVASVCPWDHPQAWYMNQAIMAAETDWVWILDLDDQALPDALEGLEDVQASVWQMGYQRTDGMIHIPPRLTNQEYLDGYPANPYTEGSAIRTESFWAVGGFQDLAFQDFALWRRMARLGCTFQPSGRVHYRYNQHPNARSAIELVPATRAGNLAAMHELERAVA